MKLVLPALAGAAVALSACAYPNAYAPGPRASAAPGYGAPASAMAMPSTSCFRTRDIRNHTIGGDHTLYLNVGGRDYYRVETSGACLAGAMSSDPIVMRQPPGAPMVCRPLDLDISISRGGFATPCIVSSVTRMTPAEVAALPPKLKP